jgi:hypothetical protein
MASFSSSFSTSVSSFSCSCACAENTPPPSFGSSVTNTLPVKRRAEITAPSAVAVSIEEYVAPGFPPAWSATATKSVLPVKKPITTPSTVSRAASPLSFAAGGGYITPPKSTSSSKPPLAPKKQHPKDILREAIKRMNEAHPEENFSNNLYSGYDEFDENIPWDEPLDEVDDELSDDEEPNEEEMNRIIERSRENWRNRRSLDKY